jgi:radical SAM protein with 4Fe4S-binding SPASM domain
MTLPVQRVPRVPRTVVWELTAACNLRCIHCEGSAGSRDPEELTPDEAMALADAIADLGCQRCNLSGGEPLMRKDWPAIARRLADRGVTVHLVTNGHLLDDDAIAAAVSVGVAAVAVSLDGMEATHDAIRVGPRGPTGSFAKVVDAMRRVAASPMKTGVITHINAWNLPELRAMHELLAGIGLDVWQLQIAIPAGRLRTLDRPYLIRPQDLEEVYARLVEFIREDRVPLRVTDTIGYYTELEPLVRGRDRGKGLPFYTGCYAGCLVMGIESNGDVKGCPSMPREFVAGNVRREPLAAIWADEERFAYNTRWDERKLTGFCATCPYRRLCRAGCTSMAFSLTGAIYENPYCLHRVREMSAPRPGGERSRPADAGGIDLG